MAREKEGYRENLELLNKRFPNVDMLNMDQVMQVIGCGDRRTLRRRIPQKLGRQPAQQSLPRTVYVRMTSKNPKRLGFTAAPVAVQKGDNYEQVETS